jgi:hypothetical protein
MKQLCSKKKFPSKVKVKNGLRARYVRSHTVTKIQDDPFDWYEYIKNNVVSQTTAVIICVDVVHNKGISQKSHENLLFYVIYTYSENSK